MRHSVELPSAAIECRSRAALGARRTGLLRAVRNLRRRAACPGKGTTVRAPYAYQPWAYRGTPGG
eukprot:scaffold1920_cov32-Phaeocystis_antarctica.AAC.2